MVIVKTPLRVSFAGGGSDMADFYLKEPGKVVSAAIDKFVYAIVKERFDDDIYINYSRKECVSAVSDIRHDLVREAMKSAGVEKGIELTTLADIPSSGSGLGSSSAVTVALLHVLYAYRNILVTAERLAEEACRIEIDILGKPIGKQDQFAAAYGGVNRFVFLPDGSVDRLPLAMSGKEKRDFASLLFLYYTGISRKADAILSVQKTNLASSDKRAAMRKMVALADEFADAMEAGDIGSCGRILDENWRLKQTMASSISNDEIRGMYDAAKKAGALGGKIAGAGGGGFMLLMAGRQNQAAVFESMKGRRELPFMFENSGSKVIFDDRSYSSK
ncbi:GHMP kinase [Candidatus Desulfarcum epimagneticum]|uniref:GHMP kinase n=1 Tax=uncultured Desulfobacteraceae bacterium TaxID=218296 RepID=A0A484HL25_9BACT|nr:GHMP kinase [uncultured Desulfobacteraceae bacterium]